MKNDVKHVRRKKMKEGNGLKHFNCKFFRIFPNPVICIDLRCIMIIIIVVFLL